MSLSGKVAVISGAGSGIGRAVCNILSRDGATIVAVDKNAASAAATIASLGKSHMSLEMDVSSSESITAALDQIIAKYRKPPTIVVNSAGITKDNYLLKMSERDFDDVIDVNLKGTFLVMQHFAQAMINHNVIGGGSIVNLASIVAKTSNVGLANYASSKSGVESMTRVASKEFGKFNIRVNAVLPGYIRSPMTEKIPQKIMDSVIQACAMKRLGEPEEIAEVISFLASDRSSFVNGASIEVTGG